MDLIKRLARSHTARGYLFTAIAAVILIVSSTINNAGIAGVGALLAFIGGAEFNCEVRCSECGVSLDSEELPDGTEPDSGEHGFRLHRTAEKWLADDGEREPYGKCGRPSSQCSITTCGCKDHLLD